MQTFTTPAAITAIVGIPAGRIRFVAGDRAGTTVEIRPMDASKGRDVKLAEQTTAGYRDGVLQITAPAGHRIVGSSGAVQMTVQLPAGSRVQATAASAQFTTAGRLGDVALDSSHAIVTVDQAATARLSTADDDITVGRLDGDAQIRTVRGDILLTEATHGTVALRTVTGTITAGAPAGVAAALDAGTTVGRIHNALTNTGGVPGLTIHATTTVGDITARSR